MSGLNRRMLLAGLGGVVVVSSGLAIEMAQPQDLFRSTLHRLLGPFVMDDAEFDKFVGDFTASFGAPGTLQGDLLRLADGLPAISRLTPKLAARVDRFQRELLTEFALATGLTGKPRTGKLEYIGLFKASACNNPYARLT